MSMQILHQTQCSSSAPYILDLCHLSDSLIVSTSDNALRSYDLETLVPKSTIPNAHNDIITALVLSATDSNTFFSASRDGTVRTWDLREKIKPVRSSRSPEGGVLCLAAHPAGNTFALGTELVGADARIAIYDVRASIPTLVYQESHNEDITTISFHPSSSASLMLSGAVDGLINLYDTTITDEDDAVLQVINHGSSIHIAEFVGKNEVLGISHMETASLYKLSYAQEDVPRNGVVEFGDLRESLNTSYVISYESYPSPMLFCGRPGGVSLVPFSTNIMTFDKDQRLDLEGGDEVIRCAHLDVNPSRASGDLLYTGGEDGLLRVYGRSQELDEEKAARKRERRESKSLQRRGKREGNEGFRFEPY